MWRLASRSSGFLRPFVLFCFVFVFCGYTKYGARAAIDSDNRCSYNRSHAVQQTNLQLHIYIYILYTYRSLDVSGIYIMLIQQSTSIVIRGMTPARSLRGTSS